MSTVKFLFRSTRKIGPITLRLLYRRNSKDYVLESKTQITISKIEWVLLSNSKRIKDANLKNKKIDLHNQMMMIESYVLTNFNNSDINLVDKVWLGKQLDSYYGKNQPNIISDKILEYFSKYLELINGNITSRTHARYRTAYEFTKKFINQSDTFDNSTSISEIDYDFHAAFEEYGTTNEYSISTLSKYFSTIKTMCNYAYAHHDIKLSHKFNLIKLKSKKSPIIYLNLDELRTISRIDEKILGDKLTNIRDWLLISCFTGQRISDFMNFSIDNIREQEGFKVMDIFQQKGQKTVTIPMLDQVLDVMKRYEKGFPRQFSDQKFNVHLKQVAEIAGIDEITYGGIVKSLVEGKRKILGKYPKYELITSHIGRRSFATNFYGKISTPWLMNITGHVKEATFLTYIGKTSRDTALEAAREFKKLKIEL